MAFPASVDSFNTVAPNDPRNLADATHDTLSTHLNQLASSVVATQTYVLGATVPTGAIFMWAGNVAPTGYLLMQGQQVSRTTQSGLFAILGTTFGAGDGSTTFTLPDLRGRIPMGAGTGTGLTARTLAGTGGEENHTLSAAELAPHTHPITDVAHNHGDPGHTHSYTVVTFSVSGFQLQPQSGGALVGSTTGTTSASGANLNPSGTGLSTTQSAGSGGSHNNIQPFLVMNYIIKT